MSDTLAISPHGPGGLLNTPGLGAPPRRRGKGRKWQTRRKQAGYTYAFKATGAPGEKIAPGITRIRGNLCNVHGKYGPCDKAGATSDKRPQAPGFRPKKEKPKKPKKGADPKAAAQAELRRQATRQQREQERQQTRTQREQERQSDRQARAQERQADRAATSRSREEAAKKREADRATRQAAPKPAPVRAAPPPKPAPAPKPEKPAKPTKAQQQATNRTNVRTQMMNSDLGLSPGGFDAFTAFADGGPLPETTARQLADMGLVEGTPPRLTSGGRAAVTAINSGDYRRAVDAIGKAGDDLKKSQATQADRTSRRATADQRRAAADQRRVDAEARRRERDVARTKSALTIYKAANGRLRWISRTTTAFKDRDGEILSVAALTKAVARMTATKQYGPLRWWHVGTPTPADAERPWGPGLDLGMCDYAAVIGRTLVESGTFFDDALGAALATKADAMEMSPGFYYAPTWREPDGTFTDMAIFERSPVPTRFGRASNYFTGFAVKEHTPMDEKELARKLAALKAETGADDATIARLAANLTLAEKTADDQRVAFKDAPLIYSLPDGTPGVIQDGHFVALKAPMAPASMLEAATTEADDAMAEEADDTASGAEFVGDLTIEELKNIFREIIQEAGGTLSEMDQKMAAMGYERRQKETSIEAQIATLESQLKAAQTQLKALGESPARPYRPSLDGQEDASALRPDDLDARRKQLSQRPSTGNPAEDALIAIAPDMNTLFSRNGLPS